MTVWRRTTRGDTVAITVNGERVSAREGESVALALFAEGHGSFGHRTATGKAAPWCMMGVCFGCLCTIDGRAGEQACLVPVREDLSVELAEAAET